MQLIEVPWLMVFLMWLAIVVLLLTCAVYSYWVRSLMIDARRLKEYYRKIRGNLMEEEGQ